MTFDDNEIRRILQRLTVLEQRWAALKAAMTSMTITNKTEDTTLDCDTETLPQLCDVVATVIDKIEEVAT